MTHGRTGEGNACDFLFTAIEMSPEKTENSFGFALDITNMNFSRKVRGKLHTTSRKHAYTRVVQKVLSLISSLGFIPGIF